MSTIITSNGNPHSFLEEVEAATPGDSRLKMCIQCGTCGGSCPSWEDMDHSPRRLFAMISAGFKEEVLHSNTPWYCVSCYYCTVRCPQQVHITDVMYTLKRMAIKKGYFSETGGKDASDFSKTFIGMVDENGRSFEFGLATRYNLAHKPLFETARVGMSKGLGMFRKGRLKLRRTKIKGIEQFKAIMAKAKELGGAS